MITFRVEPSANIEEIALRLRGIPGGVEKAARNAVSRTLKGGRQDAGRKIASRYTIAVSAVTKTLKTKLNGLEGEMVSKGSRNPLERFQIKPRKRLKPQPANGVHAIVVKGQGGNLRRGFLTNKIKGVFEREGRGRLPIRKFYSASAPGMLSVMPVSSYILAKMQERLGKNLEHAANAVMGGYLK